MQHCDSSVLARRGPQSHQTARRLHESIFRKSELTSLLIILKLRLVETATAWMKFQSGDIKYFRGHPIEPGPRGGRHGTLQAVEEVYKRLQLKLVELEGHITELKHNYVSAICCLANVSAKLTPSKLINALTAECFCRIKSLSTVGNNLATQNNAMVHEIRAVSVKTMKMASNQEKSGKLLQSLTVASMVSYGSQLATRKAKD